MAEINEKNLKKILKEQREEYQIHLDNTADKFQRHVGVLVENFDSKFDLVLEGQRALDKKIEDFRQEVYARFEEIDYKFEIILDEIKAIHNELKEKVGWKEFSVLEKKVMDLERKLALKSR